jgi:uncharacterized protein (DUF433 family)
MSREIVERRLGSFYLMGSRVPLAHIVREFQRGESPESIRAHYPTLNLEQIYGAIAFYLGHQIEVEQEVAQRESEEDLLTVPPPKDVALADTLARLREHPLPRRI